MRLVLTFILTLGFGILLSFGIASLVGLAIPSATIWVIVSLSLCWLYIGWKYATVRDRARPPQIPARCNFVLARDEIARFFSIANQEATRDGGESLFQAEIAEAWIQFRENPCGATANKLVAVAPMFHEYFEACSPGGRFYA